MPTNYQPDPMTGPARFNPNHDAGELLYAALVSALKMRGLASLHHECRHCGKLATADLLRYPEVRMACMDAVLVWAEVMRKVEGEKIRQKAEGGRQK